MKCVATEPIQGLLRHTLVFCRQRLNCGDFSGVHQSLRLRYDDSCARAYSGLTRYHFAHGNRLASRLRVMPVRQGAFFFNKVRENLNDI